jgi:hypothetical protein
MSVNDANPTCVYALAQRVGIGMPKELERDAPAGCRTLAHEVGAFPNEVEESAAEVENGAL